MKDYNLYLKFKQEASSKQDSYEKLCAQLKMSSQTMAGKEAALTSIETKWQKIGAQVLQQYSYKTRIKHYNYLFKDSVVLYV